MSTRPRDPAPATPAPGKLPLPELAQMKRRGDKIVMITAYDAPAAHIADEAGVELILVGDTAAMVMLGHSSTIPVTLEEMIFLTRGRRGTHWLSATSRSGRTRSRTSRPSRARSAWSRKAAPT
jgi:3-methyl-2-oxobutanoate hydroxymethyltransferase